MYQIQFLPQLNQVEFDFLGEVKDANDGSDIDLSIYTWKFEILEPGTCCAVLTATTANGKFTTPELSQFRIQFTKAEMQSLCPKTYPTRMTMELGDQSSALSVGPLPVICS